MSEIQQNSKIAVLLTVNNGMQWLMQQINSILAQEDVELTLFISIDQSIDGSEQLCLELAKNDPRVLLLPRKERFGSAAANFFRLLRDTNFVHFDYICFADQDDIWFKNKLYSAIHLIRHSNSDAYSSNVTALLSNGKTKLIKKSQPQKTYDYMFESAGPGCTYLLTNRLASDIQKHLIANFEASKKIELHDWYVYAFARSNHYKWHIDNESYMLYRQHTSNVVGANIGLKSAMNRLYKLRHGWFVSQAINIAKLIGYDREWPIQKLSRLNFIDKLSLAINASKFRRKFTEQFAFSIAVFIMRKL